MEDLPDAARTTGSTSRTAAPLVPGIEAIRGLVGRRRLPGRHDLRLRARRCCSGAARESPTGSLAAAEARPRTAPTCPGRCGPRRASAAGRARPLDRRRRPAPGARGGVSAGLRLAPRAAASSTARAGGWWGSSTPTPTRSATGAPTRAPSARWRHGRRLAADGRRRGGGGRRVAALLGAHARRGGDRPGRAGDRAPGRRAGRAGGGRHLQARGRRGPAIAAGAAILNDPTGLREPEMAAGRRRGRRRRGADALLRRRPRCGPPSFPDVDVPAAVVAWARERPGRAAGEAGIPPSGSSSTRASGSASRRPRTSTCCGASTRSVAARAAGVRAHLQQEGAGRDHRRSRPPTACPRRRAAHGLVPGAWGDALPGTRRGVPAARAAGRRRARHRASRSAGTTS